MLRLRRLRLFTRSVVTILLVGVTAVGATSRARLPPIPSRAARTLDTPVVDHAPGGGPYGGAVVSLAIVPTHPATVFAAFDHGGVYKSSDRGVTWTPADRGLPDADSCDLVSVPAEPGMLYAACGDGLFQTKNAGAVWRQLDVDNAVAPTVAPSDPRIVYEPPEYGVVSSRDGGRRWAHIQTATPTGCGFAFAVDPWDPRVLYCSDEQWMKVSRDGGLTWTPVARDTQSTAEVTAIAIDYAEPGAVTVGTSDGRILKTTTNGAVWVPLISEEADDSVEDLQFGAHAKWARRGSTILRSVDGGDHWSALPSGWPDDAFIHFAVDPHSSSTIFVGGSSGVFVSTDAGSHWTLRSRGITRASVSLAIDQQQPSMVYAIGAESLMSRDFGATWGAVSSPFAPVRPTPHSRSMQLPNGQEPYAIVAAGGDRRVLYASTGGLLGGVLGGNGIWRSTDGGDTWLLVDVPQTAGAGRCCQLVPDPHDSDTLYAIVLGVGIGGGGNIVRRTIDGGRTWSELPLPGLAVSFTAVATVPTRLLAQVYGTDSDRFVLMASVDRGDHWTRSGAGLPTSVELTNIVADARQSRHLLAGTNGRGVFRSVNGGISWQATAR